MQELGKTAANIRYAAMHKHDRGKGRAKPAQSPTEGRRKYP